MDKETQNWVEWCYRIPGYAVLNRNQKKNAKRKYKMQTGSVNEVCSLGCCVNLQPPTPTPPCEVTLSNCNFTGGCLEIKTTTQEENVMDNKIMNERNYLRNRMHEIESDKLIQLEKNFGLLDDEAPATPQQVVDRIMSGKVSYPTDKEFLKLNPWDRHPFGAIIWRDPAMEKDQEGYRKAADELMASATPVFDAINILDPKEALAAVQTFEQTTLH